MTLTAETASRFYGCFEPSYFRKYATDHLCPIFRIGSLTCIDDCCEIGLLKGHCDGNQFLFIESTQFFCHHDLCVINFSHDALDHCRLNTRRRLSMTFVDHTNTLGNRHSPLGIDIPPLIFPDWTFCVRRDTKRSASAVLDVRRRRTSYLTARETTSWAMSGFAQRLLVLHVTETLREVMSAPSYWKTYHGDASGGML